MRVCVCVRAVCMHICVHVWCVRMHVYVCVYVYVCARVAATKALGLGLESGLWLRLIHIRVQD